MALPAGGDQVGPPWTVSLAGLVWVHRGGLGAFVRYHDSPVGPYSEVWAAPAVSPALHIPFMAVDSEASMHAGRRNWALPKEMASFSGWSAEGDGWSVAARVVSVGLRVPLAGAGQLRQAVRSFAWAYGVGRLVRVEVSARGIAWLTPGRHLGVHVERATLRVGAPRG
jgi:hypothetical protein